MRQMAILAFIVTSAAAAAQTRGPGGEAKDMFDRAMRTADGKLLRRVLRTGEVRGVSPEMCTAFLKRFVTPWLTKTGIQVDANGKVIPWSDPRSSAVVGFGQDGGANALIYGGRRVRIFEAPIYREGSNYKVKVGFAQILFGYARTLANSPNRSSIQEIEYTQKLVESWIPQVKKIGIKGSIEPERNKFQTWDEIIRSSRAETARYKKQLGGKP